MMHGGVLALVILGWCWAVAGLVLMIAGEAMSGLTCAVMSVGAATAANAIRR